jgi:hypothetical protein
MAWPPAVRREGPAILLLAGAAAALRWTLADAPPYGDEAFHFTVARTLGFPQDVRWLDTGEPLRLDAFAAGRPLFALAFLPGARLGFDGFRALHILVSSCLAGAAYAVVRLAGGRRAAAWAAGAAVAVLPGFVVWGARVFADGLMALLALLSLAAWLRDRPALGSALMLAACWTKESAVGAAAGLAAFQAWPALRLAREEGRPLLRGALSDRRVRWAAATVPLGLAPVVVGYVLFPRLPGWIFGGGFGPAWEGLWVSSWMPLGILAACWVPRARAVAGAGAGLAAFYLAFMVGRGGFVQAWYMALPSCLALIATALALDHALRSRRWPRLWAPPLAAGWAFLLVAAVVGAQAPAALLHPLAPQGEAGLAATLASVQAESPDLAEAIAFHEAVRPARVLKVDILWHYVAYPLGGSRSTSLTYPALAPEGEVPVDLIAAEAEASDLVWLQDWNATFGNAFQETYRDCLAFSAGAWRAYLPQGCAGRSDGLRDGFRAASEGRPAGAQ